MDDADNEIYSAFFVEEEGTFSSFQGVKEVIEKHGLFCSLYTDSVLTAKSSFYFPEARGRSERMFKTLQERLPKELKLAGITDIILANQFLKDSFLPTFNSRFKISSAEKESAFTAWKPISLKLDDILCHQEERTVKKGNTVSYKGKILQIPKNNHRYSYHKAIVRVHHYIGGYYGYFLWA